MERHRKNLLYGAYIVAIAVLVIVIILLVSPKASAPTSHTKPNATSQTSQNKTSARNKTTTTKTTTGSQTANSSAPNLTNTGPGNVIAIFAGSSLVFAALHWIIQRRGYLKSSDMLK